MQCLTLCRLHTHVPMPIFPSSLRRELLYLESHEKTSQPCVGCMIGMGLSHIKLILNILARWYEAFVILHVLESFGSHFLQDGHKAWLYLLTLGTCFEGKNPLITFCDLFLIKSSRNTIRGVQLTSNILHQFMRGGVSTHTFNLNIDAPMYENYEVVKCRCNCLKSCTTSMLSQMLKFVRPQNDINFFSSFLLVFGGARFRPTTLTSYHQQKLTVNS